MNIFGPICWTQFIVSSVTSKTQKVEKRCIITGATMPDVWQPWVEESLPRCRLQGDKIVKHQQIHPEVRVASNKTATEGLLVAS
jgi:hypothetical protein